MQVPIETISNNKKFIEVQVPIETISNNKNVVIEIPFPIKIVYNKNVRCNASSQGPIATISNGENVH